MKNFIFKKTVGTLDDLSLRIDSFYVRIDSILNKRRFIYAVHLRCPFEVSFLTSEVVSITYHIGSKTFYLNIQVSEFEDIMSYALEHIDDLL